MNLQENKIMKFINLTGQIFERLTVIKCMGKNKHGQSLWLCRCDCGKEKIIDGNSLRKGFTKSCGCLQKEGITSRQLKHGHAKKEYRSNTYSVWHSILQRCNNPKNQAYKDYGGRGITVCQRWLKFENFLKDIGEIPKGLTLDRANNNRGYFPNNWRLATPKQQSRNRRNNRLETFNNKTRCRSEWEEEYNLPRGTLYRRIDQLGWSIERTLTTPARK